MFAADGSSAPATLRTLLAGVALGMLAYAGYGGRDLERPYRMPLWPLPPLVALAGVAVTASLQTGRDLAIVAGVLYDAAYLRPRRDTHWILLDPLAGDRDIGDD